MYERHRVIALKEGLHSTHPPTHPCIRPCSLLWEFPRPIITGLSSIETRGCSVVRWDVLALGFYPKVSSQFDREKRPTGGKSPESILIKRPGHHCLLTPSNLTALSQEPCGISGFSSHLWASAQPLSFQKPILSRRKKAISSLCTANSSTNDQLGQLFEMTCPCPSSAVKAQASARGAKIEIFANMC